MTVNCTTLETGKQFATVPEQTPEYIVVSMIAVAIPVALLSIAFKPIFRL